MRASTGSFEVRKRRGKKRSRKNCDNCGFED
jgi:hypothetical protein